MAWHRCPFAVARSQGVLRNKNYHCAWSMAVRHFAFCFVATFADYPCAAGIFVKRIRIGSCDTEWAHITTGLYLHQTSGYRLLSHTAPQHKRAHVPCKLCLCPITVLCVGQMNSKISTPANWPLWNTTNFKSYCTKHTRQSLHNRNSALL